MKRYASLPLLMLLTACTELPATMAESSSPPPPAQPIYFLDEPVARPERHDYAQYHTWGWQRLPVDTAWASAVTIQDGLRQGLAAHGLSFVERSHDRDLLARIEWHNPQQSCALADLHHAPHAPICQSMILRLVLLDSHNAQAVWQAGAEVPVRSIPGEQSMAIRHAIRQVLSAYPGQ